MKGEVQSLHIFPHSGGLKSDFLYQTIQKLSNTASLQIRRGPIHYFQNHKRSLERKIYTFTGDGCLVFVIKVTKNNKNVQMNRYWGGGSLIIGVNRHKSYSPERKRSNGRQKQTSEGREKGIVVIKRQLSVHIDFPVLCGVRLGLSCSLPEGLGRQWLLCQEEGGGALTSLGVSWHGHSTMQLCYHS